MKIVGLDLGSKTLGIAISDELGMLARPVTTYRFSENDYQSAWKYVIDFCHQERVTQVVLGDPKHMNGDIGIRANISRKFKENIETNSEISVILEDERLTTTMVDRTMILGNARRKERKQKKDEMAAVVILQNYLDRMRF